MKLEIGQLNSGARIVIERDDFTPETFRLFLKSLLNTDLEEETFLKVRKALEDSKDFSKEYAGEILLTEETEMLICDIICLKASGVLIRKIQELHYPQLSLAQIRNLLKRYEE